MTEGKNRRLANAIGFLSGVLVSMNALRDTRVSWPPAAVWQALQHPQRLELLGGIALIVISITFAVSRKPSA